MTPPKTTHRLKSDPATLHVNAVRWFKNGDHQAVKPIYGAGKMIDSLCGHRSDEHGFLGSLGVCPGDWIVTDARGAVRRYRPTEFVELYEERVPIDGERTTDESKTVESK